jgi:hypothetical protein
MEPTHSQKARFHFKGGRSYVHGTTIFQRFLEVLPTDLIEKAEIAEVVNFKVIKEVSCNGTIKLYKDPVPSSDDDAAAMLIRVDNQQFYLTLHADHSSPVSDYIDGGERKLVPEDPEVSGPYAGSGTIQNANNNFSLVEGLVEVNKRLHLSTVSADGASSAQIRWVILQKYRLIPEGVELGNRIRAQFDHVGSRIMEGRVYTYNKLVAGLPGDPPPATFCFSYQIEE